MIESKEKMNKEIKLQFILFDFEMLKYPIHKKRKEKEKKKVELI